MTIIDHKGRLFGLINIIDLAVLFFLLSIIAVIIFGYLTFVKSSSLQMERWITIQIRFSEIYPEISGIISSGDVEKNSSGKTIAKLTSIASITPSKVWVAVDNKVLSPIDDPVKKDIIANIEVLCTERNGVFYYKGNPIRIGDTITFTTNLYNASGMVVDIKRGG